MLSKIDQFCFLLFVMLAAGFTGCDYQETNPGTSQANPAKQLKQLLPVEGVTFTRSTDTSFTKISLEANGKFIAQDTLLKTIAYIATDSTVVNEATLPTGYFSIEIAPAPPSIVAEDHVRSKLAELLTVNFDVTFESVERMLPTLSLVKLDTEPDVENLAPANASDSSSWSTGGAGYKFRKQSFDDLSIFLSNELGTLVVDDTDDSGFYNFELPVDIFKAQDQSNWANGLKSIGLGFKEVDRKTRVTVIKNIKDPQP